MKTLVNILLAVLTVIFFVMAIVGNTPELNMIKLFLGCCGVGVLLFTNFDVVKKFAKETFEI